MTEKEEFFRHLKTVEEKVEGRIKTLESENMDLNRRVEMLEKANANLIADVSEATSRAEEAEETNEMLQTQMKGFAGFRDALYSLVGDIIDTALAGRESKIVAQRKEGLTVEATRAEIEVQVSRPTVVAEETSLRGQIAILIAEGYVDKYRSARSVGRDLMSLGYKIAETSSSIIDELDWFTQQRILKHDDKQGWMAADKSRIKVKTV